VRSSPLCARRVDLPSGGGPISPYGPNFTLTLRFTQLALDCVQVHRRTHLPPDEREFVCPHCPRRFSKRASLTNHLNSRVHRSNISCAIAIPAVTFLFTLQRILCRLMLPRRGKMHGKRAFDGQPLPKPLIRIDYRWIQPTSATLQPSPSLQVCKHAAFVLRTY
jgi:hypothetical protein